MKKLALTLLVAAVAASAAGQSLITTTSRRPHGYSERDGFRIGPRYSNYSTDVDVEFLTVESGRQHSIGLVGDYRSGVFVLDFLYDHDPENGLSLTDLLPIEFGRYSRDRGELMVGWSAAPMLDLQGGFRMDKFSVGGRVFGGGLFDGEDFDHNAIAAGVHVHTPTDRPFRLYGIVRGYAGSVDFGGRNFESQVDSTGWRVEGGIEIPIGDSNWRAVPGVEFERIDAQPRLQTDTNRFFVNFIYKMN